MSGLRIKQFREKNNYSQKDLANILQVSVRTIARWEQNNSKPNPDELKRLATLIGITEEDIISNVDNIQDLPAEELNQNIIERISDSVENLVTGQETINESLSLNRDEYVKKQNELISELQNQNRQLMSKLDEQSEIIKSYKRELDSRKIELKHKRIGIVIILVTCFIALSIIVGTWLYIRNHGLTNKDFVEGSHIRSEPSYYETDD